MYRYTHEHMHACDHAVHSLTVNNYLLGISCARCRVWCWVGSSGFPVLLELTFWQAERMLISNLR